MTASTIVVQLRELIEWYEANKSSVELEVHLRLGGEGQQNPYLSITVSKTSRLNISSRKGLNFHGHDLQCMSTELTGTYLEALEWMKLPHQVVTDEQRKGNP